MTISFLTSISSLLAFDSVSLNAVALSLIMLTGFKFLKACAVLL